VTQSLGDRVSKNYSGTGRGDFFSFATRCAIGFFTLRVCWFWGRCAGLVAGLRCLPCGGGVEISAFFLFVHYLFGRGFLLLCSEFEAVVCRFWLFFPEGANCAEMTAAKL
jgi:hypothetical protein